MIAAVLLYTEQGWNVRLTDCGGHIRTLTIPTIADGDPTAHAAHALGKHGWTITDTWTQAGPDGWVAYVEYQPDQVPA
jgi:hypothetical protein